MAKKRNGKLTRLTQDLRHVATSGVLFLVALVLMGLSFHSSENPFLLLAQQPFTGDSSEVPGVDLDAPIEEVPGADPDESAPSPSDVVNNNDGTASGNLNNGTEDVTVDANQAGPSAITQIDKTIPIDAQTVGNAESSAYDSLKGMPLPQSLVLAFAAASFIFFTGTTIYFVLRNELWVVRFTDHVWDRFSKSG